MSEERRERVNEALDNLAAACRKADAEIERLWEEVNEERIREAGCSPNLDAAMEEWMEYEG
jgi:hypothetical protein